MDIEEIKTVAWQLKRISFETSENYLIESIEEIKEYNDFIGEIWIYLELARLYLTSKKAQKCYETVEKVLQKISKGTKSK